MDNLLKDFRYATRSLRKQPAFTATVIATLALAIGASTAIFSVVEATLLRAFPFRDAGRLAFLQGVSGPQRAVRGGSIIEVQDWGRLTRTFEHVSIYDETSLNLRTADGAERVEAEMISASYFPMLGAAAQLGRVFAAAEDRVPDASPVVVISDGMWRTRFGGDPSIVGRTLTLNDRPFTVVGVMRPGFRGISFDTDVWFPAMMARANGAPEDMTQRGNRWLGAVGRLRDGVTLEAAQRDMDRVAAQLARDFPESNTDRGVQLLTLRDGYLGTTRTLVLALFGAVGLFVLIACVNILGLQLVRAAGRRREIALRMAIGADRGRLVQQLVVEGLTLAVAGAIVGLAVAHWGLAGLTALAPDGVLPNYAQPSIDLVAFGFALVVALACGVLFGVVPALRASRLELAGALKEGARSSANGFGRRRLSGQQLLVIAETAVALVLLVGAGLMVRSLQRQLAVDPGFDPAGALRARLVLPQQYTPERRLQFVEQLRARLGAIPSVRAVAVGSDLPLGGSSNAAFIYVPDVDDRFRYYRHLVAPDYFAALGIRLIRGRTFGAADRDGSPAVAIISEATARRIWRGADPVGRRIRYGGDTDDPEVTIVGVVGDVRFRDLTTPLATSEPDVYFPIAQLPARGLQVAVRSTLPPDQLAAAVRREVAAMDPTIPLFAVRPMDDLLAQQTATGRFGSAVLTAFGLSALVLAAVGLYGVLAFVVSLRRREIGIRLALGATSGRVLEGVIGQGTALATLGLAIGVAAALFSTRVLESQLFGVGARDPVVFVGAALALLVVAVAASWVPARRAARVDPQIALRVE
ncbi:MAG: ABC transporter permease [Gemmatimonadaceae bacterium]